MCDGHCKLALLACIHTELLLHLSSLLDGGILGLLGLGHLDVLGFMCLGRKRMPLTERASWMAEGRKVGTQQTCAHQAGLYPNLQAD